MRNAQTQTAPPPRTKERGAQARAAAKDRGVQCASKPAAAVGVEEAKLRRAGDVGDAGAWSDEDDEAAVFYEQELGREIAAREALAAQLGRLQLQCAAEEQAAEGGVGSAMTVATV